MAAAASSSSETTNEGPVLSIITKRIRALRKKLNRISQMEDAISQGKTLNKEQEETLRSKPYLLAGIEELEKLRQPLAQAVNQEIQIALDKIDEEPEAPQNENNAVSDLLQLIYFGSVFDVKSLIWAQENMLTRMHERSSCLTYDYVTDDDGAEDPLRERDLDLISNLGGLLVSRTVNSSLSHKNALEKCVEHAKLWIANSEQPIEPNSNITYAGLREKLAKIIASEYFTTTPEFKAPVEVAAAAGNYTAFQMPVHESMISPVTETFPAESSSLEYEQEVEESYISPNNENDNDEAGLVGEVHEEVSEVENTSEVQTQIENDILDTEVDQNSKDHDLKEQQHVSQTSNHRGGSRGYGNGRGGRGGNRGGGYQIGRGQSGGHHPRNYNNYYRGRGGRGNNYNYQAYPAGHAQEAS